MLPDIYLFNPTCEIAIANGTVSYMPNRILQHFEKDLDVLPLFFARKQDVVLVHKIPHSDFLRKLERVGVALPKFIEISSLKDEIFITSAKGKLCPWGWSPAVHHLLSPLKSSCSEEFCALPNANWQLSHKEIYSRKTALFVLKNVLKGLEVDDYLPTQLLPRVCHNIADIESLLKQWRQIVIKAPWSSSGRGLQVLRHNYLNRSIIQWIKGIIQNQGYVMVESWLNKVLDFSFHFYISPKSEIEFLGHTYFFTNSNGQYQGTFLNYTPKDIDAAFTDFLSVEKLNNTMCVIKKALSESSIPANYSGFLGVDGLVFKDDKDSLRINPCVEINLRYNMGILGLQLNKYLHPKSKGVFRIFFEPNKYFYDFNNQIEKKHPIVFEDGLWRKGYFPLVSPDYGKAFGAYVLLE